MSLILEALQKLDREKPDEARHTTVLLAPLAWPVARRRRWLGVGLGVLVVATISGAGWLLVRSPRLAPTLPTPPAPALPPAATSTPTPSAAPLATPSPSFRAGRPSPMASHAPAPATRKPATPSDVFRLTAIGDQDGLSVAVINDRLVRVGDSLLGARVVGIGESEVELVSEADGRHFTIGF